MCLEQKRILPLAFILISLGLHNVLKCLTLASSSVSQSVIIIRQGLGFSTLSEHMRESINETIQKWNKKLMFLFSPSPFSQISFLKCLKALRWGMYAQLCYKVHYPLSILAWYTPSRHPTHIFICILDPWPTKIDKYYFLKIQSLCHLKIALLKKSLQMSCVLDVYTIKCFCNEIGYLPIKWQQYWDWWCVQHTIP